MKLSFGETRKEWLLGCLRRRADTAMWEYNSPRTYSKVEKKGMSKEVVAVYVLRLSNWSLEDLAVLRGAASLGAMEPSCVIFEKAGKDGLITKDGTVIDGEEVEEACLHLINAKNHAKPAPIVKNAVLPKASTRADKTGLDLLQAEHDIPDADFLTKFPKD